MPACVDHSPPCVEMVVVTAGLKTYMTCSDPRTGSLEAKQAHKKRSTILVDRAT